MRGSEREMFLSYRPVWEEGMGLRGWPGKHNALLVLVFLTVRRHRSHQGTRGCTDTQSRMGETPSQKGAKERQTHPENTLISGRRHTRKATQCVFLSCAMARGGRPTETAGGLPLGEGGLGESQKRISFLGGRCPKTGCTTPITP
jgi:hypothetical protein